MKSWRWQILEVQSWRRVRGLAGAVRCETRDLGINWFWIVCSQDVKNILLKQARLVYWKKWTAKHAREEFKDGVWLEPIESMLRRTTSKAWTDKHRNVMRKADRGRRMGAEKIVRHWLV